MRVQLPPSRAGVEILLSSALVFFSYVVLALLARQVMVGCPETSVPLPVSTVRLALAITGLSLLTVATTPQKGGAIAGIVSGIAVSGGTLCLLGSTSPDSLQKGTVLFLILVPIAVGALLGAAQKTSWYETISDDIVNLEDSKQFINA